METRRRSDDAGRMPMWAMRVYGKVVDGIAENPAKVLGKLVGEETRRRAMLLRTKAVFWALVLVFLAILSQFLVPVIRELFKGSDLFLLPMIGFALLGVLLLVLVARERELLRWHRILLLLTGASATGFFAFVFLHNIFYGLAETSDGIPVLRQLLEALHGIFFLIAVSVCPIGFLVGVVGSIWSFVRTD
jgi:hypothetical protein